MRVIYVPAAQREIKRLDRQVAVRVLDAVDRFAGTRRGDVLRLQVRGPEWRLRVGDWRVIFTMNTDTDTLVVLHVLHRSQAYRG